MRRLRRNNFRTLFSSYFRNSPVPAARGTSARSKARHEQRHAVRARHWALLIVGLAVVAGYAVLW